MKAILRAGFIVGMLDMLAAFLHYYLKTHKSPIVVLHYIACGVFGDNAYRGGSQMALWGLLFHFVIAFVFTTLFFLLFRSLPLIRRMGILAGVIYGVFVWAVMQFLVIPLSNISSVAPLNFPDAALSIAILIVCIGIPLYILAREAYRIKT
ncbi:hypothetical protein [Parapedobacter sp. DT-150]|uniref:hypothetical protein n=1 Tax=Parapedobacter sp. DT-150 TaxID=3396162 RepID=UPI003F1B0EF8